jgi:hypothetical protein
MTRPEYICRLVRSHKLWFGSVASNRWNNEGQQQVPDHEDFERFTVGAHTNVYPDDTSRICRLVRSHKLWLVSVASNGWNNGGQQQVHGLRKILVHCPRSMAEQIPVPANNKDNKATYLVETSFLFLYRFQLMNQKKRDTSLHSVLHSKTSQHSVSNTHSKQAIIHHIHVKFVNIQKHKKKTYSVHSKTNQQSTLSRVKAGPSSIRRRYRHQKSPRSHQGYP